MMIDEWAGCYPSQWKGLIVPDAIAHPAKFSSKLIRRIYDHLKAEGWVHPGDTVIDPFGGVALGALDAMRLGLKWRGVELEERFVKLGIDNIELWNKRFSSMPGWMDIAEFLCGDSRELAKVLTNAEASVSSPPYSDVQVLNFYGKKPGSEGHYSSRFIAKDVGYSNVANASISSPPYAETPISAQGAGDNQSFNDAYREYKKTGDFTQFQKEMTTKAEGAGYSSAACVSSPPYADGNQHTGGDVVQPLPGTGGKNELVDYGSTPGQLGAMKANGFDAAVSSPPFRQDRGGAHFPKGMEITDPGLTARHAAGNGTSKAYGDSVGQLANENDPDFWTAARQIVDQVYAVLLPGAHAVWVCKDFVKNKQIVPFCDQWRQLCEAAGFTTLHEHHALLVHATEHDFDGKEKRRESKSFFRRLAENKGSPRIDYEVVYCMEKMNG